jgi:hypothetical protein
MANEAYLSQFRRQVCAAGGQLLRPLPRWVFNYNHRRPHGGISGLPPISRVPGVNNVSGQYT